MACPALPTCGLAVTEAERGLPGILDQLEVALASLGLQNERFTVRMTGCPNGCARPYNADIGLVGRSAHVNKDGHPGPEHTQSFWAAAQSATGSTSNLKIMFPTTRSSPSSCRFSAVSRKSDSTPNR